jgi:hypothetical protein
LQTNIRSIVHNKIKYTKKANQFMFDGKKNNIQTNNISKSINSKFREKKT